MKRFENAIKESKEEVIIQELITQFINEAKNEETDAIDLSKIDEGFLKKVLGGVAGFAVGPALGRTIAHALGIEKGVLYDMLTSRLVTTALGAALTK